MSQANWTELNSTNLTLFNRDDSDVESIGGASKFGAKAGVLDQGVDTTMLLDNTFTGGADQADITTQMCAYCIDTNQFGVMIGSRINAANGHGYYAVLIPQAGAIYAQPAILKFDAGVWTNLGSGTASSLWVPTPAANAVLRLLFKVKGTSLKLDVFDTDVSLVVPQSTQSIVDASIAGAGKVAIRRTDNISPVSTVLSQRVYVDDYNVCNITGD